MIENAEKVLDEQNFGATLALGATAAKQKRKRFKDLKKRSSLQQLLVGRRWSSSRSATPSSMSPPATPGGSGTPGAPATPGGSGTPGGSSGIASGGICGVTFNLSIDSSEPSQSPTARNFDPPPPDPNQNQNFVNLAPPGSFPESFKNVSSKNGSSGSFSGGAPSPPAEGGSFLGLQLPSMAIQPPTPCLTPAGSRHSLNRLCSTNSNDLELPSPTKHPHLSARGASDSTDYPVSSSQSSLDIHHSASEGSLKDAEGEKSSVATSSRQISKGSTLRSFERSPSPQRANLPAFRRGLLASGLCGGSLIAEVLLMNADLLGWAAPLMDFEDVPIDQYFEKRVMNNYFGIGLDAKIAMEFNSKRDEFADKAR